MTCTTHIRERKERVRETYTVCTGMRALESSYDYELSVVSKSSFQYQFQITVERGVFIRASYAAGLSVYMPDYITALIMPLFIIG